MNNFIRTLFLIIFFVSCSTENAPDCIQLAGTTIQKEVPVTSFEEIIVYERVKLFIEQGETLQVLIETGENLMNEISVNVDNNRLSIRNGNTCNLFRKYEITKVYVTVPNLKWLQNSSGSAVESIGTLKFPTLHLVSENQAKDLSIHTDGDFIFDLDVVNLRITNDNYSNYFLKGKVENFNGFFAAGDGRLEAANLIVQHYDLFHRGTNKLIINPQQSLRGNIYSHGDIISKNRPPVVNVTEHYRGRLIFEAP
ncbi:hypothetical protein BH23BAC2_BH23BAC2_09530 [soil metagenome]